MLGLDPVNQLLVSGDGDVLGQLLLHFLTVVDQIVGLVDLHSVHHSNHALHIVNLLSGTGWLNTNQAALGLDGADQLLISGQADVSGQLLLHGRTVMDQLVGLIELLGIKTTHRKILYSCNYLLLLLLPEYRISEHLHTGRE